MHEGVSRPTRLRRVQFKVICGPRLVNMPDMFEYARMTQRVHSNVRCIWPRASLMENHAGAEVRHPPTSAPRPETRNRREEKLTGGRGVRSVREFLARVMHP